MTTLSDLPMIPMDQESYWLDPYPVLAELRKDHRLAMTPHGVPAVLRWDDGFEVIRNTQFIQQGIEQIERLGFKPGDPLHTWRKHAMGTMEGADHRRVRAFAATALTKRKMEDLRPNIRKHAHALLDAVVDRGTMEAIDEFTMKLPKLTMMDHLGITKEEWDRTLGQRNGSSVIDAFSPSAELDDAKRALINQHIAKAMAHTQRLYENRMKEPRDDLLTTLVRAESEEGALSMGELVNMFSAIFGAGTSTSSIISSGMMELARHPEQAELLRSNSDRWKKGASEESLRCHPAINQIAQKAASDTNSMGFNWKLDDQLMVLLGAANRDPSRWEDPERFDITRDPKVSSLTFGWGAHVCLGHAMARATIEEALAVFVERCDEIELAEQPRRIPFVMENKFETLSLKFKRRDVTTAR